MWLWLSDSLMWIFERNQRQSFHGFVFWIVLTGSYRWHEGVHVSQLSASESLSSAPGLRLFDGHWHLHVYHLITSAHESATQLRPSGFICCSAEALDSVTNRITLWVHHYQEAEAFIIDADAGCALAGSTTLHSNAPGCCIPNPNP